MYLTGQWLRLSILFCDAYVLGRPWVGYVFESAVEVVNAFDFEILSWELGAGSSDPGADEGPAMICRPFRFPVAAD
jgi:hypothetical protein